MSKLQQLTPKVWGFYGGFYGVFTGVFMDQFPVPTSGYRCTIWNRAHITAGSSFLIYAAMIGFLPARPG